MWMPRGEMNSKPTPAPVFMSDPSKYIVQSSPRQEQRELGVCRFYDEVHQRLGLDGFARHICEGLSHELDRPLSDPPNGLSILNDLTQWEGRDHRDRMVEKVVLQLASGENHSIDQFLNWGCHTFVSESTSLMK